MESTAATRLATHLEDHRGSLCTYVAERLLTTYPELIASLRIEEVHSAETRLSIVAIERFNELVRAMLVFELPSLAENELRWAYGVLPRHGVTYDHQATMVRYFFDEVRKLKLGPGELIVARETEHYLLDLIRSMYFDTREGGPLKVGKALSNN
jgi:hypothetical protein